MWLWGYRGIYPSVLLFPGDLSVSPSVTYPVPPWNISNMYSKPERETILYYTVTVGSFQDVLNGGEMVSFQNKQETCISRFTEDNISY